MYPGKMTLCGQPDCILVIGWNSRNVYMNSSLVHKTPDTFHSTYGDYGCLRFPYAPTTIGTTETRQSWPMIRKSLPTGQYRSTPPVLATRFFPAQVTP